MELDSNRRQERQDQRLAMKAGEEGCPEPSCREGFTGNLVRADTRADRRTGLLNSRLTSALGGQQVVGRPNARERWGHVRSRRTPAAGGEQRARGGKRDWRGVRGVLCPKCQGRGFLKFDRLSFGK